MTCSLTSTRLSLQQAIEVVQSDDPSAVAIGSAYLGFLPWIRTILTCMLGSLSGRLWYASNYELLAPEDLSVNVVTTRACRTLDVDDLAGSTCLRNPVAQGAGSQVTIGSATRENGKLYIAAPVLADKSHQLVQRVRGRMESDLELTPTAVP